MGILNTVSKAAQEDCRLTDDFCVQRYNQFFPIRQEEPYKDRQGNWKQAWPHYVKGNGHQV